MKLSLIRLIFAALLSAISAFPQSVNGTFTGVVSDPSGGVTPNASITARNTATAATFATKSDGTGVYTLRNVPIGVYAVTGELAGFQKFEVKGVRVQVDEIIRIDVRLSVGSSTETVTVNAAATSVDTTSATLKSVVDQKRIEELPLNGRNAAQLMRLIVGVTNDPNAGVTSGTTYPGTNPVSVNGGRSNTTNYILDGAQNNDIYSNAPSPLPNPDALAEFSVQTNNFSAEFGRQSGGIVNAVTRSGTNDYHGSAFEYVRNNALNAVNFFAPVVNGSKVTDGLKRNQLGGTIGGPASIPGLYKGKDKTFFWVTEEGYRQRSPLTAANSFVVPSPLQLTGDFSEIGTKNPDGTCGPGPLTPAGLPGRCIYDPQTSPRTIFAGNKIPASRINAVGQLILNTYPKQNGSYTGYGAFNFNGSDTLGDRADEFIGKLDHQFGSRWNADFYYMHYGSKEPGGNALQNFAGSSSSYLLYRKVDAFGIQNTVTINPTTVATVGFGFNRFPNETQDISKGYNQSALGLPANYLAALSKSGFPAITGDSGLASEGTSNSGPAVYFSRNFVAGVSKSLGHHSVKLGYVYRAISLTFTSLSSTSGAFTFDSSLTNSGVSAPTGTPATVPGYTNSTGATAASLLLGYPLTGSLIIPAKLAITTPYQSSFLQDDWRVTPKLTLNLGIRYEHEPGVHERSNHYSVGFDRTAAYTVAGSSVTAVGGVEFAGQNSYPTTTGQTVNKWSPRAGFAYAITPKTVVQGGYGLFYQPLVYSGSAALAPGYVLTNTIPSQSGVPAISLSNPFPTLSTIATGNSLGLSTSIGSTLTVIDQNRKAPLYQSYSADVQQELPYGFAIKVAYVGGHARNQPNNLNINQLADSFYSQGNTALTTKVPFKYASTGSWSSSAQAFNQTVRPFPQFTTLTDSVSTGVNNYNSLAVKVQKRLSQGLTVLAAFTWASNWDNLWGAGSTLNPGNNGPQDIYNLAPEYSRSVNDIPKRTSLAVTYELPFGHGKHFLGGANRWVDLAVGGWRFNDIMIIQDGAPLPITQATNTNSPFGNSTTRPTKNVGISACYSGRPEDRLNAYFNPAAFSATSATTYGNQPRTSTCYGPGYLNSDLSLNKDFHITERVGAEFRAEALNAFNTPQFNGPNLAADSGTAGKITGTLGFPRLVQLGARLHF